MLKLGNILKEARLAKEMTLEELSSKCNYSKALISRIENNSVSPSITSLDKISAALDLKLYDVFASFDDSEPAIVRKDARRSFSQADGQEIQFLANGAFTTQMQPLLISLQNEVRDCTAHTGEEFLHILGGKAEVVVGDQTYLLGPGDSIHFKASIPHRCRGVGKSKTISLKVATPPYY
jgi:transcriptional regulator with XRE-family HTH domain